MRSNQKAQFFSKMINRDVKKSMNFFFYLLEFATPRLFNYRSPFTYVTHNLSTIRLQASSFERFMAPRHSLLLRLSPFPRRWRLPAWFRRLMSPRALIRWRRCEPRLLECMFECMFERFMTGDGELGLFVLYKVQYLVQDKAPLGGNKTTHFCERLVEFLSSIFRNFVAM